MRLLVFVFVGNTYKLTDPWWLVETTQPTDEHVPQYSTVRMAYFGQWVQT